MKRIIGFSVLILALGFVACNNEQDLSVPSDNLSEKSALVAENEVSMEAVTTESEYEVEFFSNLEPTLSYWWRLGKRFEWNHRLRYEVNHCPNVEITQGENGGFPKTIMLDYGDSTRLQNGTVLSGMIEITISAPRSSQDYQRMVQYTAFGVDSMTVDGSATIVVDKVDTMFRKCESNLSFTLADGTVVDRTSERVWQWIEGIDTPEDQNDDVMVITGQAEAVMKINGVTDTYKKEITTPLKRMGDCRYMVEGVVNITLNGSFVSSIDYGDGTCDEIAVMTDAAGNQTEIDLMKHKCMGEGEQNQNRNKNQSGKMG